VPVSTVNKSKRKAVLRQLQNVQVYTAEKVVQRYTVKYQNMDFEGIEHPGFVVLAPDDETLKVYLKDGYFENERNPLELVEKLAAFTGIEQRLPNGIYLLHVVLTESSRNRIIKALADNGIPEFVDTGDDDEEWLNSARPPGRFPGRSGQINGVPDTLESSHRRVFSTESLCIMSPSRIQAHANPEDYDPNRPMSDEFDDFNFGDDANSGGPFGGGFKIVAASRPKPGGDSETSHKPFDEELAFQGQQVVRSFKTVNEVPIAEH
jgi:hypothetical protein